MTGVVKQIIVDWLSFTVDCPHDNHSRVLPSGVIEQLELYHGRTSAGRVDDRQNYIQIALEAAIPPSLSQPTKKTLAITVNHREYMKRKMSNYDTVYPLVTLEGEIVGQIGWHRSNISQGIHVDMSGGELETLRLMGFDTQELIKHIIFMQNARITRIDLAIDVETETKIIDLYAKVKNKQIRSEYNVIRGAKRERKTEYYEKDMSNGGATIYFGGRSSNRRCRIYDKGAERMQGESLMRIEFEARGDQAKEWGLISATQGIVPAAVSFFRSFIHGWLEAEKWIEEVPGKFTSFIPRKDRPGSEKWLKTVAIPAALEAIRGRGQYASDLRNIFREVLLGASPGSALPRKSPKVHQRQSYIQAPSVFSGARLL